MEDRFRTDNACAVLYITRYQKRLERRYTAAHAPTVSKSFSLATKQSCSPFCNASPSWQTL